MIEGAGPDWISPVFSPDDDQWARLEGLALEFWGELSSNDLEAKLASILREFIDYWLEIKRLDQKHKTKKGKKSSWYMTFRSRVKEVGIREARRAVSVQRYETTRGQTGNGTGQQYTNAADRNRQNLDEQRRYIEELQGGSSDSPEENATGLQLEPSDFD